MASRHPSSRGIVYLVGSVWQGKQVIKIGRTGPEGEELKRRITQLSSGVPGTLPCIHASLVNDAPTVEKNLHTIFEKLKVPQGTRSEFFDVGQESAKLALMAYQKRDMTRFAPPATPNRDNKPTGSQIQDTGRSPRFTFAMLGIPVGQKLTLVGNEAISCEVADSNSFEVLYKGKRWALSTLAAKLKRANNLQGIRHWKYEGQTLLKRRDEILQRQR